MFVGGWALSTAKSKLHSTSDRSSNLINIDLNYLRTEVLCLRNLCLFAPNFPYRPLCSDFVGLILISENKNKFEVLYCSHLKRPCFISMSSVFSSSYYATDYL